MTIILTSQMYTHTKDDLGNKTPIVLEDTNQIKTNIDKYAKNKKRLVYVANNPDNFEENDIRITPVFKSFEMTWGGEFFQEKFLIDHRNSAYAKQIIKDADLVILSGGKCLCQMKFFKEIKLKKLLKNFDGLVIGISAGTMNLCNLVANFPEELNDLDEPRWIKGLGFCDDIVIPHFDGETKSYQIPCEEVDVVNDYVLPASYKKDFIGIPNGSYLLIDNLGHKNFYGAIYKISKGIVSIIN